MLRVWVRSGWVWRDCVRALEASEGQRLKWTEREKEPTAKRAWK